MLDTSEVSLRIEELERDHAELHRLIQRLDSAIRTEQDPEVESEAIDALVAYVDRHFGRESRLMHDSSYPADLTRLHEAEHARLLTRVKRWKHARRGSDRRRLLTFDIAAFLNAWVHHHVEGMDVKLADFLQTKGKT